MKLLPKISPRNQDDRQATAYRDFMRSQAKMGGTLFGPVPANHRREFFCLDRYSWVWHEEWTDAEGQRHAVTTRYDVSPQGVLKSQGSNSYQRVHGEELRNLYYAARQFRDNVNAQASAAA